MESALLTEHSKSRLDFLVLELGRGGYDKRDLASCEKGLDWKFFPHNFVLSWES
jgi:hypothetical protein